MNLMKKALLSISATLIFAISSAFAGGDESELHLITYESNAGAVTLIVDDNAIIQGSDENDLRHIENVGHPGNMKFLDSPHVVYTNSLKKLQEDHYQLFISNYKNQQRPVLKIKSALIGIAGFDAFKDDKETNPYRHYLTTTKLERFKDGISQQLQAHWLELDKSDSLTIMQDATLIANAARHSQDKPLDNLDFVHATTAGLYYQVRNGKLVEQSARSPKENIKHGGFYELGEYTRELFQQVPKNCTANQKFNTPILDATGKTTTPDTFMTTLQVMSLTSTTVKQYQKVKRGNPLAFPSPSVKLTNEIATKKYEHYFERLRDPVTCYNERGYQALMYTLLYQNMIKAANGTANTLPVPEGLTQEDAKTSNEYLRLQTREVIETLADLINDNYDYHKKPQLVILGEFPIIENGFEQVFLELLREEIRPQVKMLSQEEFWIAIAKGGLELSKKELAKNINDEL